MIKYSYYLSLRVKDRSKINLFPFVRDGNCYRTIISTKDEATQAKYSCIISIYDTECKTTNYFKFHFYNDYDDLTAWTFDNFFEDGLNAAQSELQRRFITAIQQMINYGLLEENNND
jgi:hypothetical protein